MGSWCSMVSYPAAEGSFTLLYVEDEEITRETVLTLLGRRFPGVTIHSAVNGAQGVQLFKELSPDLVVTDIRMPVMGGLEMARQLLEMSPSLPVIVTSAHSDVNYLIESIELGITRYVLKPIDSQKLFAAIDGCLASLTLQKELQSQQAFVRKLSRAVEQSGSSIVITNPEGVIEYVNPKFTWLTGFTEREVVGTNLKALHQGGPEIWATLAAGFEWHGELEGRRKDGELYFESTSISPVCDDSGEITNMVAVQEDITERIRAAREIENLNRSLAARAEELEIANRDLEGFSYTVSHDLRTPLTNINGYCQVILELYGAGLEEQCREFVKTIFAETINMNQLIKTLLEFSRVSRSEMSRKPVDLSEIASQVAATQHLSDPGRRIRFAIATGITAEGDPDLLRVVLQNLIGNACKYSGKREEALIEFEAMEKDGEQVYLVRDNGAGFDMAMAGKLFSPFQRLHSDREFKGFGIGLATTQRIIHRHGGKIWAEGEPDHGACFYFTLPRHDSA